MSDTRSLGRVRVSKGSSCLSGHGGSDRLDLSPGLSQTATIPSSRPQETCPEPRLAAYARGHVRLPALSAIVAPVALMAAAVWSLKPLPSQEDLLGAAGLFESASAEAIALSTKQVALDTRAFDAPLWVTPPAPPAPLLPPPPPPPLPPLRLQLIAIVSEPEPNGLLAGEGGPNTERFLSVLFYDPDTDKLLTLRKGDNVGSRTIESITAQTVTIREGLGGVGGGAALTLALRADTGASVEPSVGGTR